MSFKKEFSLSTYLSFLIIISCSQAWALDCVYTQFTSIVGNINIGFEISGSRSEGNAEACLFDHGHRGSRRWAVIKFIHEFQSSCTPSFSLFPSTITTTFFWLHDSILRRSFFVLYIELNVCRQLGSGNTPACVSVFRLSNHLLRQSRPHSQGKSRRKRG